MSLRSVLLGSSLAVLAACGGQAQPVPAHDGPLPFKTEVMADFDTPWATDFLPGSKDLESDWVTLKCGNYNKVAKKCGGQAS